MGINHLRLLIWIWVFGSNYFSAGCCIVFWTVLQRLFLCKQAVEKLFSTLLKKVTYQKARFFVVYRPQNLN